MDAGSSGDVLSLAGRTALVTGAAGGIGEAVTRLLGGAGARVVGVDLPGARIEGCETLECDVGDAVEVERMFAGLRLSHHRLDVVVHAAGITRDGVLWKLDDTAWSEVMRVNLDSAFFLLRHAVPMMRKGRGGSVVLIASINGERGKFGQANYAASKAGLIGLARTAARETGSFGIRVNVVAPGLIDTPMTAGLTEQVKREALAQSALGRAGRPDDVARAVLFLASAMSDHITGQVLRVDGGQLIG